MSADYAFIYTRGAIVYARCGSATATFPNRVYKTHNAGIAAARRWAKGHGATHAEIRHRNSHYTERL